MRSTKQRSYSVSIRPRAGVVSGHTPSLSLLSATPRSAFEPVRSPSYDPAFKAACFQRAPPHPVARDSRRNGCIYDKKAQPSEALSSKPTVQPPPLQPPPPPPSLPPPPPPSSPRHSLPSTQVKRARTRRHTLASAARDEQIVLRTSRCLQMIVPGIYVALEPEKSATQTQPSLTVIHSEKELMLAPSDRAWSHILEISTRGSDGDVLEQVDLGSWAHRLTLYVPPSTPQSPNKSVPMEPFGLTLAAADRIANKESLSAAELTLAMQQRPVGLRDIAVTDYQLLMARDFFQKTKIVRKLARADPLPKSGGERKHQTDRFERRANVLVTAPPDRRVDAVAVAMLYIASEMGCSVRDVLKVHDKPQKHCCGKWQNLISEEGQDLLDFMAEL